MSEQFEAEFSNEVLRRAFANYPTGVAVVSALVDGAPVGMAVSSFLSMSLDPPLVSVAIAKSSTTWPSLSGAPTLGLTILAEDQERACRALASKNGDRFAEVEWHARDDGAIFLEKGALQIATKIEETVTAGDHELILLRIIEIGTESDPPAPLVFHGSGYRRLAV